jgi:hypothetical protein
MKWFQLKPRVPMALCGAALCLSTGLVLSADDSREVPPPPSPKFSPHPDAVLAEDFRAPTLGDRWRADRKGVWKVRKGMLVADLPDAKQQHSALYTGDDDWTDYVVDLDVCGTRGVDKGVVVRVKESRGVGVDLRGPGYHDVKVHLNELPIARVDIQNGNVQWHHLKVEVRGPRCRVWVDATEVVHKRLPASAPLSGGIALIAYTGGVGECTVYYDNIVVTPLDVSARKQ